MTIKNYGPIGGRSRVDQIQEDETCPRGRARSRRLGQVQGGKPGPGGRAYGVKWTRREGEEGLGLCLGRREERLGVGPTRGKNWAGSAGVRRGWIPLCRRWT
jgi:hypothetical protein